MPPAGGLLSLMMMMIDDPSRGRGSRGGGGGRKNLLLLLLGFQCTGGTDVRILLQILHIREIQGKSSSPGLGEVRRIIPEKHEKHKTQKQKWKEENGRGEDERA